MRKIKEMQEKYFLKFTAGFIALVLLGIVGALAAGLYEINQEETALVVDIFE